MYWDRTGEITLKVMSEVPSFELVKADQGQVFLRSQKAGLQARFSYEIASLVHQADINADTDFLQISDRFFEIVLKLAEVRSLSRIGNRFTYHRYFTKEDEGVEFADRVIRQFSNPGKCFSNLENPRIKSKKASQFEIRFEEANTGIRLEVACGSIQQEDRADRFFVAFDVDIYTRLPLSVDMLTVKDLISQNSAWVGKEMLALVK